MVAFGGLGWLRWFSVTEVAQPKTLPSFSFLMNEKPWFHIKSLSVEFTFDSFFWVAMAAIAALADFMRLLMGFDRVVTRS